MSAMKRIRWKEGGQGKYTSVHRLHPHSNRSQDHGCGCAALGLHTRPSKQVPAERRRPRPTCKHTPPVAPWTASLARSAVVNLAFLPRCFMRYYDSRRPTLKGHSPDAGGVKCAMQCDEDDDESYRVQQHSCAWGQGQSPPSRKSLAQRRAWLTAKCGLPLLSTSHGKNAAA